MPNRVVYFNGMFVPEREARVSIFDSGYLYGETAFEMARTFNGLPFQLRSHLERLQASLKFLEIDCSFSLDELERLTLETLSRNRSTEAEDVDWHIRHDVSRGPAELYLPVFPESAQRPTVIISCWPLVRNMGRFAKNYDQGVEVIVSSQKSLPPHLVDPRAKTRSRVHFQLAQLHAKRFGPAWPVLTDEAGYLTEGPSWNILVIRDGVLHSPRSEEILHGVSRTITFDAARSLALPVQETNITGDFARQADEILCTATSFGLVPVVKFEGQPVGTGIPGPWYYRLFEKWKLFVGLDFVAQARNYSGRVAEWELREQSATVC
ncbi:MAG: Branched-chain amino acid aminotransferase [Planctomycetaceae bacterium]|nr:Branched-chain amino acid aminotransferase [Planctomycetaceae bacterium]